jgi:hypothetical protein
MKNKIMLRWKLSRDVGGDGGPSEGELWARHRGSSSVGEEDNV